MANKYLRTIYGVDKEGNAGSLQVDVYDILDAYPTKNPALDHLIKKALCPGQRGHKDLLTDLDDIIKSAERAKAMIVNKMACTTERPASFSKLGTIYAFTNVIGGRNFKKLKDAAEGICEVSHIAHVMDAPIGAAVVGSYREPDKCVEGRHCFNMDEAMAILENDLGALAPARNDEPVAQTKTSEGFYFSFSDRPTSFNNASIYVIEGVDPFEVDTLERETANCDTVVEYVRTELDCPEGAIVIHDNGKKMPLDGKHWHYSVGKAVRILINDQKGDNTNA